MDSSFPSRIIKIAEQHAKVSDEINLKIVKSNSVSVILGQIFSFLLGIISICATIYLAINDKATGAVMSALPAIIQLTMAGISAIKNK